tara:strand:+ start:3173 stop:3742 length:570 start_codon:yes stop_codon:yes gene_type:complete
MSNRTETCYFTFGRFNPPTIGHYKLLERLVSESGADDVMIFPTKTVDKTKNPLRFRSKVNWMKRSYPEMKDYIVGDEECCRTIITTCQHMMMLDYKRIVMVVGQDRVTEFDTLLQKRNRTDDFAFDKIEVVSAGLRDPDKEGAEGMSASKMRDAAKAGDSSGFREGTSRNMKPSMKIRMMKEVRKGLGL